MMSFTKEELVQATKNIRQSVCAYAPNSPMCDCKYGAHKKAPPNAMRGEKGNGCPELRNVILFLQGITEKEYNKIWKRIEKKGKKNFAKAVKKMKQEGKWPFEK